MKTVLLFVLPLLKNLSTCIRSTAVSLLTVTAVNFGVNYDQTGEFLILPGLV